MTARYTEGPWHIAGRTIHATNGELIASCTGRNEPITINDTANTRLISLAPEMAKVIGSIVQDGDRTGGNERTVTRYEIDRARALLARIDGK